MKMRIKTTFSTDKSGIIDFNYQHQIQALIYGFLSKSNPDYSQWLHQQGFVYKNDKRFKFFAFSGISFHCPIKIIRSNRLNSLNGSNGLIGLSGLSGLNGLNGLNGFSFKASHISPFTFSFQIVSPVDKFIQHLIEGIFGEGQEVRLGKQTFSVCRVETLADPLETTTDSSSSNSVSSSNRLNGLNRLNSLNSLNDLNGLNGLIRVSLKPLESPLFIKKPMPPGQQDIYLFPGDNGYEELLNQNLMHKYETLFGKPYQGETLKFYFPETKGKSVKQFTVFKKGLDGSVNPIHIKGTLQPFTVTGPKELIKIGLECGFGQNNSMGCGYVEINRDGQDRQDLWSATNEHE